MMILPNSQKWQQLLQNELNSPYYKSLVEFVENEYNIGVCYPPKERIFAALDSCLPDDTKLVIVGQDPYHGKGQANGLCFSCTASKLPPSLVNIFKEISREYPHATFMSGDLTSWARQGVLLLNSCLSVQDGEAGSHQGKGWEMLTTAIVNIINNKSGVVFMLWGAPAQKLIPQEKRHDGNLYLTSAHPSPLSAYRGFVGNDHFVKCNEYLTRIGKDPINFNT